MLGLLVGSVLLAWKPAYAQDDKIGAERFLQAVSGTAQLQVRPRHHYEENGYPEAENGCLSLRMEQGEPMVHMKDEVQPFLLYGQYQNQQRDAVFLARTRPHRDTLPNGKPHVVPRGYGALKLNIVEISIVEGQVLPHVSDQQKKYIPFPLQDWYVGGQLGSTGLYGTLRYVEKEKWVASTSIGVNPFAQQGNEDWAGYSLPMDISGGIRRPGFLSQYIGENAWTAGGSLFVGAGEEGFLLPGAFVEWERFLDAHMAPRPNYRRDARPHNYEVQAIILRLGAYLNTGNIGSGRVILPTISIGYQFNLRGPRIPKHDFKKTEVVYLHDIYREDLERQLERREDRNREP